MRTCAAPRRLAVATAAELPALTPDDAPLLAALSRLGIEPLIAVWNDIAVDWAAFDAVLIRTIWDYYTRHAAFLTWLDRLDQLGVPVINDSTLLRWNSDKRYLLELAAAGVDTVPTRIVQAWELPAALAEFAAREVVVKPVVSGGAWHTLRGRADDPGFLANVTKLPAQLDYLVQPFLREIIKVGEWSLLYFDGVFSHAVNKRAASGDYRVQAEYGGSVEDAEPDAAIRRAAEQALAAVAVLGYADHAYVRVDGVVSGGRFLIMELEMIEPFLFLGLRAAAAQRLAQAVKQRLLASSLGGTHAAAPPPA